MPISTFRVLVGAKSDPSISVDDPISDEFFFLTWNAASKLNASIYDKVEIKPEEETVQRHCHVYATGVSFK